MGRDDLRHSRQTRKHKSRIPCPNFGESRFPGNSQIPDPVNIFIVFPIPAPYFGQIPNPENTLPDPHIYSCKVKVPRTKNEKRPQHHVPGNMTNRVPIYGEVILSFLGFSPSVKCKGVQQKLSPPRLRQAPKVTSLFTDSNGSIQHSFSIIFLWSPFSGLCYCGFFFVISCHPKISINKYYFLTPCNLNIPKREIRDSEDVFSIELTMSMSSLSSSLECSPNFTANIQLNHCKTPTLQQNKLENARKCQSQYTLGQQS